MHYHDIADIWRNWEAFWYDGVHLTDEKTLSRFEGYTAPPTNRYPQITIPTWMIFYRNGSYYRFSNARGLRNSLKFYTGKITNGGTSAYNEDDAEETLLVSTNPIRGKLS
jgi:hypothetical protein